MTEPIKITDRSVREVAIELEKKWGMLPIIILGCSGGADEHWQFWHPNKLTEGVPEYYIPSLTEKVEVQFGIFRSTEEGSEEVEPEMIDTLLAPFGWEVDEKVDECVYTLRVPMGVWKLLEENEIIEIKVGEYEISAEMP